MSEIDSEKLRKELIELIGSYTPINKIAYSDLIRVQMADENELIEIARYFNIDLDEYKKGYARSFK